MDVFVVAVLTGLNVRINLKNKMTFYSTFAGGGG